MFATGGRSTVFRTALDAFGLHALGHLGASVATRGYTTGVVTASTVVLPYWLWAGRRLAAEGVPGRSSRRGVLLLGPLVWGAHVAAAVVVGRRRSAGRDARPTGA